MSAVSELPLVQMQPVRSPEWLRAAKRARHLSWFSLVWATASRAIRSASANAPRLASNLARMARDRTRASASRAR